MSRRSRAREVALQSLYRADVGGAVERRDRDRFHRGRLRSADLAAFADALVDGVGDHRDEIDTLLDGTSANWRVSRMAATDRAVLRIAAFELLHTDTPGPVVVDEAIELARRYGSLDSPAFVAGILGAMLADRDGRAIFKREGRLVDEEFLGELRAALVKTDMGPAAAEAIVADVRERLRARVVDPEVVLDSIRTQLLARLKPAEAGIATAPSGPTVILVTGVNGSGKTTSIAKLARLFSSQGKRVVLGAGDTFRAAAVEQLAMWAGRLGAEIVRGEPGCDPASVAHRAVARAVEGGFDVCIVDTAGRLQTQANLMQELAKIRRVIAKQVPDAPHETLLVLDATAGQNALSQAKGFTEAAGCTGIVLAKLDGSARGGVIVPVAEQFGLPVKFVGVGESADDLQPFRPEDFLAALLEGSFAAAG